MTDLIVNQCRSMPQHLAKISEMPAEEISKYKVVYVYTHFLEDFFHKFYDHLGEDTVLISHNSDIGIHGNMLPYLEGNKIKMWFCQNRETSHPKLISLPIGLANSQWIHGDQNLIKSVRDRNNPKTNLVFKNFDIGTNTGERLHCHNITQQNGIPISPPMLIEGYWNMLSSNIFAISPPGNGIDCHRIWESLYLRTVPVVKRHEAFSQFLHLPILFVDSWEEVTLPFLEKKSKEYINQNIFDIPLLEIEYWRKIIRE